MQGAYLVFKKKEDNRTVLSVAKTGNLERGVRINSTQYKIQQ